MRHKLIVFEGIDGVGKTTLSKKVAQTLNEMGIPCIRFEDVEDKEGGFNLLKPWIKENASNSTSFHFYLASALHKSSLIREWLDTTSVVCDRYVYSTIADHRFKGEQVKNAFLNTRFLWPDHLFLVTLPEELRQKRISERSTITKEDTDQKVPGSRPFFFEETIRSFSPIEIDNSGSLDETVAEVLKHVLHN